MNDDLHPENILRGLLIALPLAVLGWLTILALVILVLLGLRLFHG